ncbi:hypothetical protein FBY35_0130 [Streptomyces sp. SLBN-118]|uniref:hypothetical protein n=1 Tax=Streptomyces sp. SLBN-118 TaxID=2768454 RepID=UPI0011500B88|nr:hypothetical protein [Streptomyces sp. SLBN-118]TQK49855.1 hypothetical protein FBY35_0130 [Streptomyces sp. SLBN-118]
MPLLTYTMEYFDESSARLRKWGAVLLAATGALWLWFAVLLFTPYTVDQAHGAPADCDSRFFTDRREANELAAGGGRCEAERDWPELLAVLAASIPTAIAGTALYTTGKTSIRINRHVSQVVHAITPQNTAS